MHSTPPAPRLVILVLLASLCACGLSDDEFIPDCDLQQSGGDVNGQWTLSGEGERSGCASARLDGELTIAIDGPLHVVATAQDTSGEATGVLAEDPESVSEADAFVIRILRSDHTLSSDEGPGIGGALSFTGATTGSCVDFVLEEALDDGQRQTIVFQGSVRDDGTVKGLFEGDGPGSCEVSGRFTVDIR